ncbi:hypothetical protein [Paenibacillus sp. LK1]|uniref:hypothetical protein n=1 Tax=Paenibacillus sp. LK1 TaxID=2053014 RepID=UPI000C17BCB3|nr:hypothetical protein [Paenibacillus sp. LK1]PIH59089.1 hypothetical protein CS562_14200 [Paenibacillus sp. LK1]
MKDFYYATTRWIDVFRCKMKYPDYADNEYNQGRLKHIWGVKSSIDNRFKEANMYTLNDIEVIYDRKNKLYFLHMQTQHCESSNEERGYLQSLLLSFEDYMDDNGFNTNYQKRFLYSLPNVNSYAESIEELYINFKMYVKGYCSVYEGDE